jgi:hypothetical protein
MTMMEISLPQIKKIKAMQRAMGLDDDGYREMLWGVAKVKSCKELKGPKIQMVIKHLERCLGKDVGRASRPPQRSTKARRTAGGDARPTVPLRATEAQQQEIRRLWGRVSRVAQEWGPESRQAHQALDKFLWSRFKVGGLGWLTLAQAQRVIEAIKAMGWREQACCNG